jgi:hypothetical protein
MNDPFTPSDPEAPRPRHEGEYQDPQYHDEELELAQEDGERRHWPKRKNSRLKLPKRRYED